MKKLKTKAHALKKSRNGSKSKRRPKKFRPDGASKHSNKRPAATPSNPCSQSFNQIRPALELLGWRHLTMYSEMTSTGIDPTPKINNTQAMLLRNDFYNFIISSYNDGVNIGKFEVWDKSDNKIESAKKLITAALDFLNKNSIENVYAITQNLFDVKDENVVLTADELNLIFKQLGFVETHTSGVYKWSEKGILNQFLNIDSSILKGTNDSILDDVNEIHSRGGVMVFFEFLRNPSKNFISTFYVGTDNEIKELINIFKTPHHDGNKYKEMINFILSAILGENKEVTREMASQLFQQLMAVNLGAEAKDNDYQNSMTKVCEFFIPVLHLLLKGNSNNIAQYRLVFDEKRETMDIGTRSI